MAKPGDQFTDPDGNEYRYESMLGDGGQAVVWKIRRLSDGKEAALKLFKIAPTGQELTRQIERLRRVCDVARQIAESLPEAQICFPLMIYNRRGEFGVLMELAAGRALTDSSLLVNPLRQPEKYISQALSSVVTGEHQYWHFLLAGFHLSRAVAVIHRHGMTHCDLSLANVFVNPADGRVSIIDCDNLACGGYLPVKVVGTPGFRAPELILDQSTPPSPESDRHSLAVLLFCLAMFRHPLVGNTGANWNPSFKTENEAFGTKAVFTDHPKIKTNRFKNGLPFEALPTYLRSLFTDSFTDGLHDPKKRPQSMVWARELWRALENMTVCTHCKQRFFVTDSNASCLFCGAKNPRRRWRLCLNNGRDLLAEPGRKLYEHHLRDMEFKFQTPLAELKLREGEMVIKNLCPETWKVRLTSGGVLPCETGKAFRFKGVTAVDFGRGRFGRIERVQ